MTIPGGYLTLEAGNPTPTVDLINQRHLHYPPDTHGGVPLFDGTDLVEVSFLSNPFDSLGLMLDLGGGSGGSPGGEVLITGSTPIGTMTQGGGVAAAFNGTTSQSDAASARYYPSLSGYSNRVGLDHGAGNAKTVTKAIWNAPNNNSGAYPGGWKIEGSNNGTTWTTLFSKTETTWTVGQVYTATGINTSAAYRFHCLTLEGNSVNSLNVAELQLFETTEGSGSASDLLPNTVYDAFIIPGPALALGPAWTDDKTRSAPLAKYKGLPVNAATMACYTGPGASFSCPQYKATNVGTVRTDPTGATLTFHATTGQDRRDGVWNRYNQRDKALRVLVPAPTGQKTFEYIPSNTSGSSHVVFGPLNGDPLNRASIVTGEPTVVDIQWHQSAFINAYGGYASFDAGIGLNGSVKPTGYRQKFNLDFTANIGVAGAAHCVTKSMGGLTATMLIRVGSGVYDGSPAGKVHIWGGNGRCGSVGPWSPGYCYAIGDYYDEGDDQVNQVMIPRWRG